MQLYKYYYKFKSKEEFYELFKDYINDIMNVEVNEIGDIYKDDILVEGYHVNVISRYTIDFKKYELNLNTPMFEFA